MIVKIIVVGEGFGENVVSENGGGEGGERVSEGGDVLPIDLEQKVAGWREKECSGVDSESNEE